MGRVCLLVLAAPIAIPNGAPEAWRHEAILAGLRVLAGLPHMHHLGAELTSWIARADSTAEDLIHLTGWNFEVQRYYLYDTLLRTGDTAHTRCGFANDSGAPAQAGLRTEDEMCFDFLFVTDP